MTAKPDYDHLLDVSLGAYRSAVKAFSREIIILGLIALTAVVLSATYLTWSAQKLKAEKSIPQTQEQLEKTEAVKLQLARLQADLENEKSVVTTAAETASLDLATRFRGFIESLSQKYSLFPERPELFTEIAQYMPAQMSGVPNMPMQMQRPMPAAVEQRSDYYIHEADLNREKILNAVFGLSAAEIEVMQRPGIIRDRVFFDEEAYAIAKRVFLEQIQWGYDRLNQQMLNRHSLTVSHLENEVAALNKALADIQQQPLPSSRQLLPEPEKLQPSGNIDDYATVRGKTRTMTRDTDEMVAKMDLSTGMIDRLLLRVEKAAQTLARTNRNLQQEIDAFKTKLKVLQADMEELQQKLINLTVYTKWLPGGIAVDSSMFVQLTPLMLGLFLLLLGIRYTRLLKAYCKLEHEFARQEVAADSIRLFLSVPDSLLEWFGGFEPDRSRKFIPLPAAGFAAVVTLIVYIARNPAHQAESTFALHAAWLAALLGNILMYHAIFCTKHTAP